MSSFAKPLTSMLFAGVVGLTLGACGKNDDHSIEDLSRSPDSENQPVDEIFELIEENASLEEIAVYLEQNPKSVNARNEDHETPLMVAVIENQTSTVQLLIGNRKVDGVEADIDLVNEDNQTADEIARELLQSNSIYQEIYVYIESETRSIREQRFNESFMTFSETYGNNAFELLSRPDHLIAGSPRFVVFADQIDSWERRALGPHGNPNDPEAELSHALQPEIEIREQSLVPLYKEIHSEIQIDLEKAKALDDASLVYHRHYLAHSDPQDANAQDSISNLRFAMNVLSNFQQDRGSKQEKYARKAERNLERLEILRESLAKFQI